MRYIFTLAALLLAGQLAAQQATQAPPTETTDPVIRTTTPGTPAADAARDRTFAATDAKPHAKVFRASKIMGVTVKNKANENLGTINDLVINPEDGRVAYAAVSMGGFLGVGDKLFAVPFEAIECREVNGEHVAMLDINKESLQNAQGFDEENWPNMADQRWRTENDRPYQALRMRTHQTLRPVQQPGTQPAAPATQPSGAQPQQPAQPQQQ